jgi:hypothetical protein
MVNLSGPPGGNGVRCVIQTTVVAADLLPGVLPIRQRVMRLQSLPGIPPETEQPNNWAGPSARAGRVR